MTDYRTSHLQDTTAMAWPIYKPTPPQLALYMEYSLMLVVHLSCTFMLRTLVAHSRTLYLICKDLPMVLSLCVTSSVFPPILVDAAAASTPACPPPTTTTSNLSPPPPPPSSEVPAWHSGGSDLLLSFLIKDGGLKNHHDEFVCVCVCGLNMYLLESRILFIMLGDKSLR